MTALALIGLALFAAYCAIYATAEWLTRRLRIDLTPEPDREPDEHLPIHDAAVAAIRERGAMVAADDSWLRGAS